MIYSLFKRCSLILSCVFPSIVLAQDTPALQDTIPALPVVTITAYGHRQVLLQAPAAINYIDNRSLGNYSSSSVLEAINATPGIRMEERSPGSYRINIRGSSLRSPFGVRNVKIYYNNIPVTDPGGFSYFNQFGFYNIRSIEVIKGPGSSLYGAGTGGVLLMNSMVTADSGFRAIYEGGSYGLINVDVEEMMNNATSSSVIRYQHNASNGYRTQSSMFRDVLSLDNVTHYNGHSAVDIHLLYNRLNYQTPGALTLAEFNAAPVQARPRTNTAMGAVESNAHIFQQNVLAGTTYTDSFGDFAVASATIYGSFTRLENPTIRNYSRTNEPHFGGRVTLSNYLKINQKAHLQVIEGAELQAGYVAAQTYSNSGGRPDTLQSDDEVRNKQVTLFLQPTLTVGKWIMEAGISLNKYKMAIDRIGSAATTLERNYPGRLSPRVAVSFNLVGDVYLYANVSGGFSPPSSAEVLPSGSSLNTTIDAETGWNYEAGSRGRLYNGRFFYDVSVFYYTLSNAIVLRKDASGADNYINAGSTSQPGAEASLSYNFLHKPAALQLSSFWLSYSHYDFRYRNFVQDVTDLTGKRLPGVAANTFAAGISCAIIKTIAVNASWFYSDRIALNNTNTECANPYNIVDAKISWNWKGRTLSGKIYIGANNLLSCRYSLGNDINAGAGRYYNSAMPANFYAGIMVAYQ
jgi:iron complex outermembrane receptor protein